MLHRELQKNGALSAGISVENTPQAWDAATCVDPLCYPVGFRTACEVTSVECCCSNPNLEEKQPVRLVQAGISP